MKFEEFKAQITPDDKVLVLFSGGLDSTTALYRVLSETDCKVITHHVVLKNEERRGGAEITATVQTLNYLENIRPFKRSNSLFSFGYDGFWGYDVVVTAFIASLVMLGEQDIKYIVNGWNAPELADEGFNRRTKRGLDIIDIAIEGDEKSPIVVSPVGDYNKRDIVDMIPTELAQLTWSCRTPIFNLDEKQVTRCGECKTCVEMKEEDIWDKLPNNITVV